MAQATAAPRAQASEDRTDRRAVFGWSLFDLANSVSSVIVVTSTFPLWFHASGGSDGMLGVAKSSAETLALLCALPLGLAIDRSNRRVVPLLILTAIGVGAMALMGIISIPAVLALYVITIWSLHLGQLVYESMLPDVSGPRNRGRISGIGISLGYLGSFVGLFIEAGVLRGGAPPDRAFQAGALGFALLSLPIFLWVRERPRHPASDDLLPADGRVSTLLAPLRGNQPLARLVVARLIYATASTTIVAFGAIYAAAAVGLDRNQTRLTIMLVTLVGAIAALIWGRVTDTIGYRTGLMIALANWVIGFALMAAVPLLALPTSVYWLSMVFIGIAFGTTLTSERPLIVALSRPGQTGQTFGLFSMTTRTAAIIGPLLWALIAEWIGLGRPAAVIALAVLAAVAMAIAWTVREPARPR
ncbi:MAG: MFS transporter [Chloroflexota bacterium]